MPEKVSEGLQLVDSATFFDIVNLVLPAIGRAKLPEKGSERSVIQVQPTDRVLQILAGPGSGKTEMLVWRVLFELLVNGTPADQIVVTTFTNRAASELQVRVVERCEQFLKCAEAREICVSDPQVHNLRVGTIHSLCDGLLVEFDSAYLEAGTQLVEETEVALRMARTYRFSLGFNNPPGPKRLVNRLLDHRELLALFRPAWEDGSWPGNLMARISFLLALLSQHIETWIPRCSAKNIPNGIQKVCGPVGFTGELIKLQGRWERYLDEHHVLDFATIQKRFFERQQMLVGRFQHIFVDEFQDSNPIQFAIHTRWLLNPTTKLTVVGDDDQAIYRFRGSDIGCFQDLKPYCETAGVPFRIETLGVNHRSMRAIVDFSEAFKNQTVLKTLSLPKKITPVSGANPGVPVRLLLGGWDDVCAAVAHELDALGIGKPPQEGIIPPTAAVLMFSTSERKSRSWTAPARALRVACNQRGLRVYNARNKTAGADDSPVAMLLGLISYLIDPVSFAAAGKNGRQIMVWASSGDLKSAHARSAPPAFSINDTHINFQKKFIKGDGGDIGSPSAVRKPLINFVDSIRNALCKLPAGQRGRLTMSGFVARLLAQPLFRNVGFNSALFREALFTQLLEANIAPTRLTMDSLDQPLEVSRSGGKYVWPARCWNFLNYFGAYLSSSPLDDPDVEAFEEDAILMITFHQAKGLEFDHVYIAGTGRNPDLAPALRTRLFSGEVVKFSAPADQLATKDRSTKELALADREREVYVAMTRAKKSLTFLHDPASTIQFMALNPAIEALFPKHAARKHKDVPAVLVREAM